MAVLTPATAPAMRHSEQWLAALRIGVGAWFLKSVITKLGWTLLGGVVPVPSASQRWVGFLPERLLEYADGNPIGWYRDFLLDVAIPQAPLFAQLTAFGEAAVGVGLVLGLLTGYASIVGIFLMSNYLLANFWLGPSQQGFHLLLIVCMLAFLGARAGRRWGVDGWLRARLHGSRTSDLLLL